MKSFSLCAILFLSFVILLNLWVQPSIASRAFPPNPFPPNPEKNNTEVKLIIDATYFRGEPWPRWAWYDLRYILDESFPAAAIEPLHRCLNRWAGVTNFRFIEDDVFPDLDFRFQPIDGPGTSLARATPPTKGLLTFDNSEQWSYTIQGPPYYGIDFESVCMHEMGHILGIDHTDEPGSLMNSYYIRGTVKREPTEDDIEGIRYLYKDLPVPGDEDPIPGDEDPVPGDEN